MTGDATYLLMMFLCRYVPFLTQLMLRWAAPGWVGSGDGKVKLLGLGSSTSHLPIARLGHDADGLAVACSKVPCLVRLVHAGEALVADPPRVASPCLAGRHLLSLGGLVRVHQADVALQVVGAHLLLAPLALYRAHLATRASRLLGWLTVASVLLGLGLHRDGAMVDDEDGL